LLQRKLVNIYHATFTQDNIFNISFFIITSVAEMESTECTTLIKKKPVHGGDQGLQE
jgi:hypothetical protein